MIMTEQEFAEHIVDIRKKSGLSLRDFAKEIGFTHITIWNWEKASSTPHESVRPVMVERLRKKNFFNKKG